MFYEAQHSQDSNTLLVGSGTDFRFPPHLHEAFELISVRDGKMSVTVGRDHYEISPGEAVLVFPDQVHAIDTVGRSSHYLLVFAVDYVKAFSAFARENIPECNRFRPSPELLGKLFSLKKEDGLLRLKSILYALVDEFDANACYRRRQSEEESLLLRIFDYVSKNYMGECTLRTLSDSLSYHYVYLSRYFSERTGMSFTGYVNRYRISEAGYRLTNTSDRVTDVALECGFDSLRSFHRNFKAQTGQTPAGYRTSFRR